MTTLVVHSPMLSSPLVNISLSFSFFFSLFLTISVILLLALYVYGLTGRWLSVEGAALSDACEHFVL